MKLLKRRGVHILRILFPHPPEPLLPSNTTRSPISFRAVLISPRPSPSPDGRPESSKRELNDSMWGVTNSLRMLYVEPSFGGFRKAFSRAKVLNEVGWLLLHEPSGILKRVERVNSKSAYIDSRSRGPKNCARVLNRIKSVGQRRFGVSTDLGTGEFLAEYKGPSLSRCARLR